MIYIRLGGVVLHETDKAWRASALEPNVQVCATNLQLVRHLLVPKWPDADLEENIKNSSFCEHRR